MVLERYSLVGVVFSLLILAVDLYLLRKHKIDGVTFTRWFIIGIAVGLVSIFPAFLSFIYLVLGTEVLVSAVTISSFMFLLLLIFYLDYKVNRLNDMLMKLTALIAVEKYRSRRKDKEEEDSNEENAYQSGQV